MSGIFGAFGSSDAVGSGESETDPPPGAPKLENRGGSTNLGQSEWLGGSSSKTQNDDQASREPAAAYYGECKDYRQLGFVAMVLVAVVSAALASINTLSFWDGVFFASSATASFLVLLSSCFRAELLVPGLAKLFPPCGTSHNGDIPEHDLDRRLNLARFSPILSLLACAILCLVIYASVSGAIDIGAYRSSPGAAAQSAFFAMSSLIFAVGAGRLYVDGFVWGKESTYLFGFGGIFFIGALVSYIFASKDFSFVGVTSIFMVISVAPSIVLIYSDAVTREEALDGIDKISDASEERLLGRSTSSVGQRDASKNRTVSIAFACSLAALLAYAVFVSVLYDAAPALPWVIAAAVIALDCTLAVSTLSLGTHDVDVAKVFSKPSQKLKAACLMLAAHLGTASFGTEFWFLGHCWLFLFGATALVTQIIHAILPLPDDPARLKAAAIASMVAKLDETLDVQTADAQTADGQTADANVVPESQNQESKRTISEIWNALTDSDKLKVKTFVGLICCFLVEIIIVGVSAGIGGGSILKVRACGNCADRPQALWGLAAYFALGAVGGLYWVRNAFYASFSAASVFSQPRELGRALLCWYLYIVGFCAYLSYLFSSLWLLISSLFLPLVAGSFVWGVTDFKRCDYTFKIYSDVPGGDPEAPGDGNTAPGGDIQAPESGTGAEANCVVSAFRKLSTQLQAALLHLISCLVWAVLLHAVLSAQREWIGWTVPTAILILELSYLTMLSFYGTMTFGSFEQGCSAVWVIVLLLWGLLLWQIEGQGKIDLFALGIVGAVVLYPGIVIAVFVVHALKERSWNIWEESPADPDDEASSQRKIYPPVLYGGISCIVLFCVFNVGVLTLSVAWGFCLFFAVGIGLALFYMGFELRRRQFFVTTTIKRMGLGIFILIVGGGLAVGLTSESGTGSWLGFSVAWNGIAALLGIIAVVQEFRASVSSSEVFYSPSIFPVYTLGDGAGVQEFNQGTLAALAALIMVAIWGFSASFLISPSYMGMYVSSLVSALILILCCHKRALSNYACIEILKNASPKDVLAARRATGDAFSDRQGQEQVDTGSEPSEPSGPEAESKESSSFFSFLTIPLSEEKSNVTTELASTETVANLTQTSFETTFEALKKSYAGSLEHLQTLVLEHCQGRFSANPCVAVTSACKERQGSEDSEKKPKTRWADRAQALQSTLNAVEISRAAALAIHQYAAVVQLALIQRARVSAAEKQAECMGFLDSINATGGGFTLDMLDELSPQHQKKIEAAWAEYRNKEAQLRKEAEDRRRQDEEARKRREEDRQKREEERKRRDEEARQRKEAERRRAGELKEAERRRAEELKEAERRRAEEAEAQRLKQIEDDKEREEARLKAEAKWARQRKEEEEARRKEEEARRKEEEARQEGSELIDFEGLVASIDDGSGKFVDEEFPPNQTSLGEVGQRGLSWKRYSELVNDPVIADDGFTASDINQGALGDCWFLSAIACIAEHKQGKLLQNVMVKSEPSKGIYLVQFYLDGHWRQVVIDDYFPVRSGMFSSSPAFATSGNNREVWVQVIEKAYAKCHHDFHAIEGGFVSDGLVDLTGGSGSTLSVADARDSGEILSGKLWSQVYALKQAGHLLGAGSHAGSDTNIDELGIVQGHAYSVLDIKEVDDLHMIRLRNPWGSGEWKGPASDGDTEFWTQRMKAKLEYVDADDGSFWMRFEDFVQHYDNIYVCRLLNDKAHWDSTSVEGTWSVEEGTAGGCSNFDTWDTNPRIILKITPCPTDVIVTLTKSDERLTGDGSSNICHGFQVFKKVGMRGRGSRMTDSGNYTNQREVFTEVNIGGEGREFFIIPSTFHPGNEASWTVRVFWRANNGTKVQLRM